MGLGYYFASLPPLEWGKALPTSSHECLLSFKDNFSKTEQKKLKRLREFFDVFNVLQMMLAKEDGPYVFHPQGNLSQDTMRSLLENPEEFPPHFEEYFLQYRTTEERLEHFSELMQRVFLPSEDETGFIRDFFSFEWGLRMAMGGYKASILNQEVTEVLPEDTTDDLLFWELLKQQKGRMHFPPEWQDFSVLLEEVKENPRAQYDMVAKYRFEHYYQVVENQPTTMDAVFAYIVSLWILEDYWSLQSNEGFEKLIQFVESENAS